MALEVPLFCEPAIGDPTLNYSGAQLRSIFDMVATQEGCVLDGDFKVSQRALGANMSVDVAAGAAFVTGDTVTYQGKYLARSTSMVNVPVAAAPGSGTRIDLITVMINDKQVDGGTSYSLTLQSVTGTVGAGVPATPNSSIPLAQITLTSATVSILTAAITDARPYAALFDPPIYTTVTRNTNSATINAGTTAPHLFTSVAITGTRNLWDGANRLTAPVKGLYDLNSNLSPFLGSGGNQFIDTAFRINGTTYIGLQRNFASFNQITVNTTVPNYPLNVGDYVECVGNCNVATFQWNYQLPSAGLYASYTGPTFSMTLRRRTF